MICDASSDIVDPLNILLVSNLYVPDFCGGAAQFTDLAEGLAELGHAVTVYTTDPYYPEWKRKSPRSSVLHVREEEINGVTLFRHWIYVPSNPKSLLQRLLYELSFCISLCRSLFRGKRVDVVLCFCPLFGAVLFSLLRKFFRREPVWISVQDIPTDASMAAGISKPGLFMVMADWLQAFAFRSADRVSTISPVMAERLQTIVGPRAKVELCPNWLVGELASSVERIPKTAKPSDGTSIRLLYCGNIGEKQGLVDVCKELSATDIDFTLEIRGAGSAYPNLKSWVQQADDDRFRLGPFLPNDEFVQALAATDLFLICEKKTAGFSFIPSKLIPCIAVGTPLLAVSHLSSPLGREVAEHGIGVHVEPGSGRIADAILEGMNRTDDLRKACLIRAWNYRRTPCIERYERIARHIRKPYETPKPDNTAVDRPVESLRQ